MATLQELEELKIAEQGNQQIRDAQRVQDFFNDYKSQGSFLLQKGQITEEQYFQNVRNMGVRLELIGADEYPDEINEYVKPAMSITGATIGGVVGAALTPFTGGLSLLLGSSAGAAVGAGVSEIAYRGVQELSAPDALPLRSMEEVAQSAGKEAGVTGALSFGIGGVLMNAGRAASAARSASAKTVDRWTKVDPNKKQEVLGFVDKAKLKIQSYYVQPEMFRQEVAKLAKEQGITLPNSVVASPLLKSLAEAFSRTPLLGADARAAYSQVRTDIINRVIKGTKNGETPEQSINAFLSNYKLATSGKKIGQIVPKSGKDAVEKVEELALSATASALKNAKNLNDKVLNSRAEINSILKSDVFNKSNVALPGFVSTYARFSGRGELGTLGEAITKNIQPLLNKGQISGKDLQRIKTYMDDKYQDYLHKGLATNATGRRQRDAFNKVYNSFYDDLARNVTNKSGYNAATQSLKNNLKKQRGFMQAAEDSGVISSFNNYVRNLQGTKRTNEFTKAVHDDMGYNIVDDVGRIKPFPGMNADKLKEGLKVSAQSEASRSRLVKNISSKADKDHKQLKQAIGNKAYNRLARNEMDAKFEKTFIAAMNGEGKASLNLFTKMLKEDKSKIENLIKNGKFNFTFKDLESFGTLIPYLPSQPALNQFIQRNMMLNLANGGAIAALGSVTGGGAVLGGTVGAAAGFGALFMFNRIMAQPYVKGALQEAAKAKGKEQVAKMQGFLQIMNNYATPFYKGQEKVIREHPVLKQYLTQGGLQFLNENIAPDFSRREEL